MAYIRGIPYVYWTTDDYGDSEQLMIDCGSRGNARVSYELCKNRPRAVAAMFTSNPTKFANLLDAMTCFVADVEFKEQQNAIRRDRT